MHYHRLLPVKSASVDSLADVVAGLLDDFDALRLHAADGGTGMASGAEGLLLHDRGYRVRNTEANHSFAGAACHSAAHSLPNSSAHTAAHSASCDTAWHIAAWHNATIATHDIATHDSGTGTSRPLQLRSGRMDDVGSRQKGMVLHQSQHLRRQSDPGAASS